MSLLATGVTKKGTGGTEMIPVKSMSSVTTKKDGVRFTAVSVICSGNTVDFRVGHSEAAGVKDVLSSLILGRHPAQQPGDAATPPPTPLPPPGISSPTVAPPPPPAEPAPAASLADELKKLADLRDAGILTNDEFAAQKARLLGQ